MPVIRYTASIDVRAPAAAVYALIETDLLTPLEDPASPSTHRPLGEGPLRSGFRWLQTYVHERQTCTTEWETVCVRPAALLEAEARHYCAVRKRETRAGERWEFREPGDGSTQATLSSWRAHPGLDGWLARLFGASDAPLVSLRKRLSSVQYRAEQH